MPRNLTEAELERVVDRAVQRRLATDSAYRNAENADAQAEREQEITDEELARATAGQTTREEALVALMAREGAPLEAIEDASTESLLEALKAPEGQPCNDCGRVVVWRDDDWHHVHTPTGCFLRPF